MKREPGRTFQADRGVTQGHRQKNYMFRELVYPDSESHFQRKWTLSRDFSLRSSKERSKGEKTEQGSREPVCRQAGL